MVAKLSIIFQTIDILAHIPTFRHYRTIVTMNTIDIMQKRLPREETVPLMCVFEKAFRYAPSDLSVVNTDYLVTLSSHFTIPSIVPIEMIHTIKNTVQHCQIGQALYINGPIHNKRLPTAVAPSHRPWQRPCRCFGATFDTNERPSGEINNSATVRKK